MSDQLIKAIRAARQSNVKSGKYTFVIRRPTVYEYMSLQTPGGKIHLAITQAGQFVVDWQGFSELDFISAGSDAPVKFDQALLMEWIVDKPEIWTPLITGILEAFNHWIDTQGNDEKN